MLKRSHTDSQAGDSSDLDEKENTLSNYLLSLFETANNLEDQDKPLKKVKSTCFTNTIIRTSFKDYHVHDLIVKRSGLFKTMLESHETWNLEKVDEKQIINLIECEKSIFKDESPMKQDDFEVILRYLYSDEIEIGYLNYVRVRNIVAMARFFDLNCLNEYLLRIYGNEDNNPYTGMYFQIKHLMEIEFTEEDFVEMVFNEYDDWKMYSNELVDLICQQEIVPLEKKLSLLTNQIKTHNQVTTIVSEHLKPFEKSLPIIQLQAKCIFKGQIAHAHNYNEISTHLGIDLSPNVSGSAWKDGDKLLSSQVTTNFLLVAEDGLDQEIKFFEGKLLIRTSCGENNSSYWWRVKVEERSANNSYTVYYKNRSQPISKINREDFIYAEQFRIGGERIHLNVMIRSN